MLALLESSFWLGSSAVRDLREGATFPTSLRALLYPGMPLGKMTIQRLFLARMLQHRFRLYIFIVCKDFVRQDRFNMEVVEGQRP